VTPKTEVWLKMHRRGRALSPARAIEAAERWFARFCDDEACLSPTGRRIMGAALIAARRLLDKANEK
jgi:hypothetical protein